MRPLLATKLSSWTKRLTVPCIGLVLFGAASDVTISEARASVATPPIALLGNEIMTDRCSGEVAFPPAYDGKVDDANTHLLKRDKNGKTEWTKPFTVKTSAQGRIRWYCRSQSTWHFMDPGAWTFSDKATKLWCLDNDKKICIKIPDGTSATDGWYPERSRCDSRTTRVRARLGPDRLLQIECLPKVAAPTPKKRPTFPPFKMQ